MSLHTHHHVRGLNTHHQIVISHILDHMHLVQRALNDPLRSYSAVFFKKGFLQGTAVDAHADRNAVLFRLVHHGLHLFLRTDISRIDPDLIRPVFDRRDSKPVIKMNIRHQGGMDLLLDLFEGLGRLHSRNRTPDNLASGRLKGKDLGHGSFHVLCLRIGHGLDRHRIHPTDLYVSNRNLFRLLSVHSRFPLLSDEHHLIAVFSLSKRQSIALNIVVIRT